MQAIETIISNLAQEMASAMGGLEEQSGAAEAGADAEQQPINGAAAQDSQQLDSKQVVHCSDQGACTQTQDLVGSISQDGHSEGPAVGLDSRPAMLQASGHPDPQPAQDHSNSWEAALHHENGTPVTQGNAANAASPSQPGTRPSGAGELDRQPGPEITPAGVEPNTPPREASTPLKGGSAKNAGVRQKREKPVGRNHPCPCGSHKKFKACCGRQPGKPSQSDSKVLPDEGVVHKERPHMATLFV